MELRHVGKPTEKTNLREKKKGRFPETEEQGKRTKLGHRKNINFSNLEEQQPPTTENGEDNQWWVEKGGRQVRGFGLLKLLGRIHVFKQKQVYGLFGRAPRRSRF